MKIKQFSLKNNLNVFLLPQPAASFATVQLTVNAGSVDEPAARAGLAHFLEHMAFKGTKKWPTAQKLAKTMDEIGAVYNAYTGKDETAYWIKAAPEFLPLSLEVLSQMWTAALIKEGEIKIERGVILEEINMYKDRPQAEVDLIFEEEIFGKTPLGRPIIGGRKTVEAIRRADFLRFKNSFYQGGRMSLAVVGKIGSLPKTTAMVKKLFSSGPAGERRERKMPLATGKKTAVWRKRPTEQTHFILGGRGAGYGDRDKYALKVLMAVLGGGMSSRLWRKIRERRGLAYYVYCAAHEYDRGGSWELAAGVSNQRAKEAIEIGRGEILSIGKTLKKSEVEKVKKMLKGRFLISLEDSSLLARMANRSWLLAGRPVLPEEVIKRIEAVSYSQVVEAAGKFIDPKAMRLAAIGPEKKFKVKS